MSHRDKGFIGSYRLTLDEGTALLKYAKLHNEGNVNRTIRQAVKLLVATEENMLEKKIMAGC
jgi:hypothetical protein